MSDAVDDDAARGVSPSRRLVLRGGLVLAVASAVGCTPRGSGDTEGATTAGPTSTASGTPNHDVSLLTRAIVTERALVRFTSAAARRFPGLEEKLEPLTDIHRAHVQRLRSALVGRRPEGRSTPPKLPRRASDVEAALGRLESRAQARLTAGSVSATSGALAELMGSTAASDGVLAGQLGASAPPPVLLPPPAGSGLTALVACLEGEYAALYAYGVLGGILKAGASDTAVAGRTWAAYDAHRERRDVLLQAFSAGHGPPPAAEAVYELPFTVSGAASARRLARYIEDRCCGVYAEAIATTTGEGRRFVTSALFDCAARSVTWGGRPVAFPGLPSA